MKTDLIKRSNIFAHRCVKLAIQLPKNKLGSHIEGQLIRCSTSVAANYRAACLGQSKKAFISKLGIVIEEADERIFWIEFAKDENLINVEDSKDLVIEAKELTSIFIASRITAVRNLNSGK
ncbi:four helix bundle protein [Salegentibacter sp. LM13S]|uniref:four helix bundle protein n=1 Tax=Salegentibacter lacus TaxID=2873599 RepID=UPI001CCB2360|nr:four helix bundle protein [Salegentibacter lacus]MBZ9630584.1 four helix bundle protein [Salegentibacter lacus]